MIVQNPDYLSQTGSQKRNSKEIKIKVTQSRNSLNKETKPPNSLFCKLKGVEFH